MTFDDYINRLRDIQARHRAGSISIEERKRELRALMPDRGPKPHWSKTYGGGTATDLNRRHINPHTNTKR